MHNDKKLKLEIILILIFISSSFLIAIICMFLRDIPALSSLLYDYRSSGNSIFIPSLPYINLLWFLPKKYQIFRFSLGHLIDIILICNLFCFIDSSFYHYIKKVYFNGKYQIFIYIDSYQFGSKGKLYALSQDPEKIFGLKEDSRNQSDDKFLKIINEKNSRLNEEIHNFYGHFSKKRHGSKIIQKRIFHKKSEFTLNNCYKSLRVSYCVSVFEKFWICCLKNPYFLPKTNIFTASNKKFSNGRK